MYTPRLKDENVKQLYQLKLILKKPMTRLLNEAVEKFLTEQQQISKRQQRKN